MLAPVAGAVRPRADTLPPTLSFLTAYGVDCDHLVQIARQAQAEGLPPQTVWLARSGMPQDVYFRSLAHWLGLPFAARIPDPGPAPPELPDPASLHRVARFQPGGGMGAPHYIAPDDETLPALIDACSRLPQAARGRLAVVPRDAARRTLEARLAPLLSRHAAEGLARALPRFSARQTITPAQTATLLLAFQAVALTAWFAKGPLLLVAHLGAGLFFLSCALLRLVAALRRPRVSTPCDEALRAIPDARLPRYGVLVALYREAGQVAPLLSALEALEWPRDRLDIRILCEIDDVETCAAVARELHDPTRRGRRDHMHLTMVPVGEPRTKPKALAYGLPLVDSDLVVVFDAEDRPHPLQLREAYAAFAGGVAGETSTDLACVQAPLTVHNGGHGWWARQFAFEYDTLFRGLLPALAAMRLPLPLGGTSNHFRRDVLDAVGGWDPHNVTEDADLGMRLARAGWRTGTITRPTWEEAPFRFVDWLPQRTRWFKGWMQTWLVHMRRPARAAAEFGLRGTLAFHVLVTGLVLSALVHPLLAWFVVRAGADFVSHGPVALLRHPLLAFDLITLLSGYACFAALGWESLKRLPRSRRLPTLLTLPLYWLAQSLAAWRALVQLVHRPHHWEKTTHRLSGGLDEGRPPALPAVSGASRPQS